MKQFHQLLCSEMNDYTDEMLMIKFLMLHKTADRINKKLMLHKKETVVSECSHLLSCC